MSYEDDRYKVLYDLYSGSGKLDYSLAIFGDELADREGYRSLRDIEAIHFYLIQKYGWTPSQVRGMSLDDIRFVLTEEMEGWVLPEAARKPPTDDSE